jgi:holin-like protein
MRKIARFIGQLVLLWGVFWVGSQITLLSGLPIPGNVFGMILLFGMLSCGVVKLQHVQEAADFLLKHMLFFFVPIAVGLMNWSNLFYQHPLVLTAAIVIGAVIPYCLVGFLTQYIDRGKKHCNN